MHGFTMALAREVARKGVTVELGVAGLLRHRDGDGDPRDRAQQIIARSRSAASASPRTSPAWSTSSRADDAGFITGANLPVNGGCS